MRLKKYTVEEIRENMNNIVYLNKDYKNVFFIQKPDIVKVTEKTFKTAQNTIRFNDVGYFGYSSGYFFKQDIDFVVESYKQQMIEKCERTILKVTEEIEMLKNLKIQA